MKRFEASQLTDFLRLVDSELRRPCRVVIIGGAALSMAYHSRHATSDVDVLEAQKHFWEAYEKAKGASPHPIPIHKATVADPPYNYEDRLQQLRLRGLKKLKLLVPEAHDLAMLKAVRGYAHDLEAIEDIHRSTPLALQTLIERYEETRVQAIGNPHRLRQNFLAAVARLWGEAAGKELDSTLK